MRARAVVTTTDSRAGTHSNRALPGRGPRESPKTKARAIACESGSVPMLCARRCNDSRVSVSSRRSVLGARRRPAAITGANCEVASTTRRRHKRSSPDPGPAGWQAESAICLSKVQRRRRQCGAIAALGVRLPGR